MRQETIVASTDPPRGDAAEPIAPQEAIEPIRAIMPAIYERLLALTYLDPDWDSHGGKPLSPLSIGKAVDLLVGLANRLPFPNVNDISPSGISPLGDGGIQLEWRGPLGNAEVESHPHGEYSYLLIEGHGNARRFEDVGKASPLELLRLLSRILVAS
jgi:hypothetical protein